jgi:hypothetical protein
MSFLGEDFIKDLVKSPRTINAMAMVETYEIVIKNFTTAINDLNSLLSAPESIEVGKRIIKELQNSLIAPKNILVGHLKKISEIEEDEQRLMDISYGMSKITLDKPLQPSTSQAGTSSSFKQWDKEIQEPAKSEKPKEKPMPNNTPTFNGNRNENVEEWLFIVKLNLRLANIPKEKWLVIAAGYVKNGPLQLLKKTIMEARSWDDFESEIVKVFGLRNMEKSIIEKLKTMKMQHFNSFEDYVNRYLNMLQGVKISDLDQLMNFTNGLPEKMQIEIGLKECKTVHEAIACARVVDSVINRDNNRLEAKTNYVQKFIPKKGKFLKKGKNNNYNKNGPKNNNNKAQSNQQNATKEVTCYK